MKYGNTLKPKWMAASASLVLMGLVSLSAGSQQADEQEPVSGPGASVGQDYVIGPGDSLQIFVWRNDELSATVPVRPDGKISTPLVEDVVAVGKTPSQLARHIETILSEFIRTPKVNVIVATALSASSQVRVVGQAMNPRAIPYRDGLTILDVVIDAGGLGEFAAGNRAKLVRKNADGTHENIKVRLEDLLEDGDMSQNLPVQPGDVLIIPESRL
jgi:polysaccharide export outer membrane protein